MTATAATSTSGTVLMPNRPTNRMAELLCTQGAAYGCHARGGELLIVTANRFADCAGSRTNVRAGLARTMSCQPLQHPPERRLKVTADQTRAVREGARPAVDSGSTSRPEAARHTARARDVTIYGSRSALTGRRSGTR
jgi:hypothetical protein